MSAFASLFVERRHRFLVYSLVWTVLFVAFFCAGWAVVLWQLAGEARRDRDAELARAIEGHAKAQSALERLNAATSGPGCSQELHAAMQKIAFLPDGLNNFLYAPDGVVRCSTSRQAFEPPVRLGSPDIEATAPGGMQLWLNRDLTHLTDAAPVGTIASKNDFAVVIPPYSQFTKPSPWLRKEVVAVAGPDRSWSLAGNDGLYRNLVDTDGSYDLSRLMQLSAVSCNDNSPHCVATQVLVGTWAREWIAVPFLIAALSALLARMGTSYIATRTSRYWSFESRFNRHPENVIAVYQPIVDLRSGKVSGCEVLARWRDLDGTIVTPDVFLGIVERSNRTAEFTQRVVDRAHQELSARIPPDRHLDVNFNIFGRDLASETLLPMFAGFIADSDRFTAVIEIVEHHDLEFDSAQQVIHDLRRAGLEVYIDDFGIGYSSIERAATLAADGVKLDRAFAMAPAHSIMERLLLLVLDMLKVSGRQVVVEGVETAARLDLLTSSADVDYVQGYAISRPLFIADFAAFLQRDWREGAPVLPGTLTSAKTRSLRDTPAAMAAKF